ncbi:lytic transglycosylase domain-containing protein [Pseudonocardia acaciae]|uniref:lytic transglycosylase domain-containing protein n=1 Tax=Pseudonocardia acaciae TaxID=551276 RepID=UPI000687942D|nr:lytic transglycosylase domain-containing protein [Pseudonocardia acaciae]
MVRVVLILVAVLAVAGCAGGGAPPQGPPGSVPPACPDTVDPAALACRINAGEAAFRGGTRTDAAEAGARLQAAYRDLAEHPEWDAAVLGAVGPELRDQVGHAVAAARELTSLAGAPSPTMPPWRIVDPLPGEALRGFYDEGQRRFGVRWSVLAAINLVETRMGRIVGTSTAAAQGPMQFIPTTWASYGMGGDVWQPRDAILGAANYLAANGGASDATLDRALKRYNNDVRYVRAVRHYAAMMDADPRAFDAVHAWPVEYRTTAGDIPLPTGYASDRSVPVQEWLASHPR